MNLTKIKKALEELEKEKKEKEINEEWKKIKKELNIMTYEIKMALTDEEADEN